MLTAQALHILSLLQNAGNTWLNRKGIAQALGKKRLNPYNLTILHDLAASGFIEIQTRPNTTPVGFEFIYRAIH